MPYRHARVQEQSGGRRRPLVALLGLLALLLSSLVVVAGAPSAGAATASRSIGILAADEDTLIDQVRAKLAATGEFSQVTTLPQSTCDAGTPSLSELQQYDAIFLWSDCTFDDPTAVGDVLADYVDGGGRLVISTFATATPYTVTGRLVSGGYLPATTGGYTQSQQDMVADLPNSPLLAGVPSFSAAAFHGTGQTLTPGATLVAHWTDGEPLLAYKGDVVELNLFPPYDTDGTQLMVNALRAQLRPRVAILASGDTSYFADVQSKLDATGAFAAVDVLPEDGNSAATPTLTELQAYDDVFVWADFGGFQDPTAVGDVLADYIDGGGHVLVSTFALYGDGSFVIGGRFASGGYLPTTTGSQTQGGSRTFVADLPDNPLLAGVTTFDGGSSSYHHTGMTLTDGSTLVAHWTDGSPFLAYRGNVVELNFYPPSSDVSGDFWDASTDGTRLMVNALGGTPGPTTVAPAITSADTTSFTAGAAGTFTVTSTGTPTATLTESGTLPAGVTFTAGTDGTATLAGTPAAGTGGSYPVTITAGNGTSPDATQSFTLVVDEAPAITSSDSAAFTVGSAGSAVVTTMAGYPAATTLTESGDLPQGVTFVDNGDGTATLSGTPADGSAGSYPITVTAANTATSSQQTFTLTVSLAGQTVAITSTAPAPSAVVGQTYAVTTTPGASGNPVTLSVATPDSCSISGTTVTFTHPGTCVIDADEAGDGTYSAGHADQTVAVMQAATTTALSVTAAGPSATVSPVAPGAGTPTGVVTFSVDGTTVGSAVLVDGTATLAHPVAPGKARAVAAVYSGDADFAGSSASTARKDPRITATVSSARPRTGYGWYRTPVKVTFHCTTSGADLTASCPAPVTLTRNAAGQSVTRTVHAVDGGAATVTVRGINIDAVAPRVSVTGVKAGAVYPGVAPAARCAGSDALSGLAHCTLTRRAKGESVTVTATATDRAGNTRSTTVRYTVARFYLAGAAYRNGAYQVKEGRSYVVVALVAGTAKPRYYNAAPHGRTPTASPSYLKHAGSQSGLTRYVLRVRIDRNLGRYALWDMGVKVGGTLHRIVFRPSR